MTTNESQGEEKPESIYSILLMMEGALRWHARNYHEAEGHDTNHFEQCKARRCKQAAKSLSLCDKVRLGA